MINFTIPGCTEITISITEEADAVRVGAGNIVVGSESFVLEEDYTWTWGTKTSAYSATGYLIMQDGSLALLVDEIEEGEGFFDSRDYDVKWAVFSAISSDGSKPTVQIFQPIEDQLNG